MLFRIITLSIVVIMCPGCLAFYSHRPVEIKVHNTNTGEPIADVLVEVYYRYVLVMNAPEEVFGQTDINGRVTLKMADFKNGLIILKIDRYRFEIEPQMVQNGVVLNNISRVKPFTATLKPE